MDLMEMKNWRFHLGDIEEAWYKGYDDSAWQSVVVPHDWSVHLPFEKSNSSGTGYVSGGVGWYRCRFTVPKEYEGRSVSVVFDGVYKNSQVWVNGYYLGKRPNGYISFSYDISQFVSCETENVICVKVTHNDLADSRWFTGSGIYRKVTLKLEENVHPAEYGIRFTTLKVDNGDAKVSIEHNILNCTSTDQIVKVTSQLIDVDDDSVAASFENDVTIAAKGSAICSLLGTVKSAKLWSDVAPNRYILRSFYETQSVKTLADEQYVGIRTFEFNGQKGFLLNGVPTVFKGVCVHHDGGALGAAMTKEVWQRRLTELRKAGCNAIRCSHNPHMPELYDLCDAMGFLMMDEAFDEWENAKNKWSTGHNVYPPRHQGYFEDFPTWHDTDLRAMIRRDYNHPSIFLWSIGNEIDYPNDPYAHPSFDTMTGNNDANKPAAERQYDPNKPNMERLIVIAKELVDIVKQEDTTRPVTLAAAFPELSSKLGLSDYMDVVSYNYKEHLYDGEHERYPQKAFLGSENGHSKEAWDAVVEKEYVCGQFLWTGIDYLGEAHGWPIHGSGAGYLTTAGFRKKRFYERCELWGADQGTYELTDNAPSKLNISVWSDDDAITGDSFACASGKNGYIFQILMDLVDEDGKLCLARDDVKVQVTGAGELVCVDNGDLADLTSFTEAHRTTYDGHLVAYVRRNADGPIKVYISDDIIKNTQEIAL